MLDKLEMFIALARERHFGRAAERLNISQPTLSAGIKHLEDALGVQLVYRGSRFGGLTPEGQSALVWAQRLTGDARQFREEMRTKRQGLSGEVRLACIPTALTQAAHLSSGFGRKHPGVRFTILSRNSREILKLLEDFEIHAGISYLDNEPLGRVDTCTLYRETYMLVCAADMPLARRTSVTWDVLNGVSLALLTPDMQNRRILNQIFAAHGVTPDTAVESNSVIALMASVTEGHCMTVLPSGIARFLTDGKPLALVPLDAEGTAHDVGLVVPQRDPASPVIGALLTHARKTAQTGAPPSGH